MLEDSFLQAMNALQADGNRHYVIGLSGGADSVALTRLVRDWLGRSGKITLCHLNHEQRGADSIRDEEFCIACARSLEIPIVIDRISSMNQGLSKDFTSEDAMRRIRYRFFQSVCERLGDVVLLLAHHRDDLIETVLMNVQRGAGLSGLAAIPLCRDGIFPILRPLLGFTRQELLGYLASIGQNFCLDLSNNNCTFRRNFLRNRLIPEGRKQNISFAKMALSLARLASRLLVFEERISQMEFSRCQVLPHKTGSLLLPLDRSRLAELTPPLRILVLRQAVFSLITGGSRKFLLPDTNPLEQIHCHLLSRFVTEGKSGDTLHLPGGLRCRINYAVAEFYFEPKGKTQREECFFTVDESSAAYNDGGNVVFRLTPVETSCGSLWPLGDKRKEVVDLHQVSWPLTVRSLQPGDRFCPLGMKGKMLISDYFTNRKVPREERKNALVVEDSHGIIWLWPYQLDHRVRCRADSTRCVMIQIERL